MNNIITQIKNREIQKLVDQIAEEQQWVELRIDQYEEFFHAMMHVDPKLFLVEIDDLNNPFLKIIKIVKKSILTKDVPIVAIVSLEDKALIDAVAQLDIQALVYPPYSKNVLKLNLLNTMKMKGWQDAMQTNQDLQTVQSVMISGLASLAEYRDPETGEHIKRTQNYVKALATALKKKNLYLEELTPENIEAMYMSAPLHDIGKVGIRDEILLKPSRLTEEEFEIMKTHTTIGYESIINVGNKLKNNAFLEYAAEVAYTHHEKYDGSGYPRGLRGKDIPLIGRLMAVADVYDALTSKRVYKEAMSHEEAMAIVKDGVGKHFDPEIVDCAFDLEATFQNIAFTYRDNDPLTNHSVPLKELFINGSLKKILVVEDSRIVREITRNQFKAIGFEVDMAKDGEEGYHMILKGNYDLVLLDIEMPKMNGYEMAEKVIDMPHKPVLIAMTAADFDTNIKTLKPFGIQGLVLKPVDFNRLATIYTEASRS